jgi:UDP-N-acetylmuramoyl-tripeptide--D-alanyl-D-alanine ligase
LLRVESPLAAADALASRLAPGDALLLKASRGVALEAVLPRLKAALEAAADPADPA